MKVTLETRTIVTVVLAALCCVLAFLGGVWHLPERNVGWFESAAMLLLISSLDGAAAMRTIRRESTGNTKPPPPITIPSPPPASRAEGDE